MLRRNKNKKYIYGIVALALVSVATVGFSTWIINGSVTSDEAEVNVTIEDMLDKTTVLEYKAETQGNDLNIRFDYDKDPNRKDERNPNIIYDDGETNTQDLTFVVVYTLKTNADSNVALNTGNYQIILSFDETTLTAFNPLSEKGYLDTTCLTEHSFILPTQSGAVTNSISTIGNKVVTSVTYDTNYKVATITSTFNFAWGTYFNNDNPCYYKGDDYIEKINAFASDVKGKTFNVNLNITSNYQETSAA